MSQIILAQSALGLGQKINGLAIRDGSGVVAASSVRGPSHLAAERNPQIGPKRAYRIALRCPHDCGEAAHTFEFREVLHRGPKIAACLLVEAVSFELLSLEIP
jgi:hypothetical protein